MSQFPPETGSRAAPTAAAAPGWRPHPVTRGTPDVNASTYEHSLRPRLYETARRRSEMTCTDARRARRAAIWLLTALLTLLLTDVAAAAKAPALKLSKLS